MCHPKFLGIAVGRARAKGRVTCGRRARARTFRCATRAPHAAQLVCVEAHFTCMLTTARPLSRTPCLSTGWRARTPYFMRPACLAARAASASATPAKKRSGGGGCPTASPLRKGRRLYGRMACIQSKITRRPCRAAKERPGATSSRTIGALRHQREGPPAPSGHNAMPHASPAWAAPRARNGLRGPAPRTRPSNAAATCVPGTSSHNTCNRRTEQAPP